MDTELYRTFLAIADSGGFTAAAQIVGRTQSAVSQQVRRLEELLGQPLIDRSATPVTLTEYGKALLRPAREIVDMHDETMALFRRKAFEGIVVVGVADAYVNRILKDVMTEFAKLLPQGTISIVIDDSLGLSRRIANGSVDLAFVTEGNCPTRGPVAFTDRLVVVGPAAVDLSKVDPLPVAVWDERNQDELPLVAALEAMNRRYRPVCVCRSVFAQHQAVTANLCVAVLVEGSMVAGERAYLEADGFPVMNHLTIRLERSYAKRSHVIDQLEKHYLDFFGRQDADRSAKET
ncbi:LysR family transcriptional regulator [Defluviimonas sp. SAOS-178_SWC]|uniref:LysR family transcriptional regulator n=1 Tax=Defluviimonas sp. SAOS-178_SWC TaxID=3121287 RepID=UPI003222236E